MHTPNTSPANSRMLGRNTHCYCYYGHESARAKRLESFYRYITYYFQPPHRNFYLVSKPKRPSRAPIRTLYTFQRYWKSRIWVLRPYMPESLSFDIMIASLFTRESMSKSSCLLSRWITVILLVPLWQNLTEIGL